MNRNKEIMEMARRICRTSTRIMERCQRERTQSGGKLLSPTQYHLCEVVRRCQPVTVTELARQFLFSFGKRLFNLRIQFRVAVPGFEFLPAGAVLLITGEHLASDALLHRGGF
jgi:hypothetical protein